MFCLQKLNTKKNGKVKQAENACAKDVNTVTREKWQMTIHAQELSFLNKNAMHNPKSEKMCTL